MNFNIYLDNDEDLPKISSSFEVTSPIEQDAKFLELCKDLEYDLDVLIDVEDDGISIREDEGCLDFQDAVRQVADSIRKKYGVVT